MKLSKHLYSRLAWLLLSIALLGFLDASYLAIEHYRGVVPPCSLVIGCERVTTSGYATIMNIPVALLGSLYYLAVICLLAWYLKAGKEAILTHVKYITIVGLVASAYFVYLQVGVIGAICQYCMLSAATSTALFIMAWSKIRRPKDPAVL